MATLVVERVGLRQGAKVLATITCWWTTHRLLGHAPTIDEYAEDWGMSLSTAYREQARFREALPEVRDPSGLAAACGFDPATDSVPAPMALGVSQLLGKV